jgi:hypothetical protein
MRTIKFRVYDNIYNIIIDDYDLWAYVERDKNNLRVLPNYYLMQYTEIKDKNGKEIYEGDIVEFKRWNKKIKNREVVIITTYWVLLKWGSYRDNPLYYRDTIEVIGNIYENPELLN